MIDFPASPTPGQRFTAAGATWIFDGVKWLPEGLAPTVAPGINDNRIINGDMRIDQRNNGAAQTVGGYIIDRWGLNMSPVGKLTMGRNLVGATGPAGFPYCFGVQSTSAYASAAGDFFQLFQMIEADMISDFAWGTPQAQPVTLSFWAYANQSGTFSGAIRNYAGTRGYPFTFALSNGVWTKVVVTISGDTAGTWVLSGNGGGAILSFDLGSGSTYRGPPNAWTSTGYIGAAGSVSLVATNGASFGVTGVKLEIGSVATPFNRQSLAKSMADCQRYYSTGSAVVLGYTLATQNILANLFFPVIMRANPTIIPGRSAPVNMSGTYTSNVLSTSSFIDYGSVTATGVGQYNMSWTASAEL